MIAATIFTLGLAFVVYVLAGYPLLLALRARRSRPIERDPNLERVTVLLAVRNGERWIAAKLRTLAELDYPRELLQILVISDGSTDGTDALVEASASGTLRLIRGPSGGKAAALNAGIAQSSGDILFFTDVRQRLEPNCLRRLVAAFADRTVGVASGELVIVDGVTSEEASVGLYWRYEKWIRERLSMLDSVPGATGCIYAMRRDLAVPLPADTILDDVYLPLAAFFRGYRVIWDSSAKAYDEPASLGTEFRRKVRTQAGVYQVMRYYPQLLLPWRNRIWLDFVSHKLARLLLPLALLAMAVSSLWLPPVLLGLQAAFYLMAAADGSIPDGSLLKRASSPARTFVVLMAAALCAAVILVKPQVNLWGEARR
ncbi:MAG: glycosyltransferase family 2 protein [Bryobacteraceae bacterium]